jgi:hypothetical protein
MIQDAAQSIFLKDHVFRDASNRPIARAVLRDGIDYQPGQPIQVSLLMISAAVPNPLTLTYYADGYAYHVPPTISSIRVSKSSGRWNINSFVMEPNSGK